MIDAAKSINTGFPSEFINQSFLFQKSKSHTKALWTSLSVQLTRLNIPLKSIWELLLTETHLTYSLMNDTSESCSIICWTHFIHFNSFNAFTSRLHISLLKFHFTTFLTHWIVFQVCGRSSIFVLWLSYRIPTI